MIHEIYFSKKIFYFLAKGFSNRAYDATVRYSKAQSIQVSIVGLTSEVVVGESGLKVRPDFVLSELVHDKIKFPGGVVLGGGIESVNLLVADPRVHMWLKMFTAHGLCAVALRPLDYQLMIHLTQSHGLNIMIQDEMAYEDFFSQYISRIHSVSSNLN